MKKLIGMALSLAMLLTCAVFAAPVAVNVESTSEAVVNAEQLQTAKLAGDNTSATFDPSAVFYGERFIYRNWVEEPLGETLAKSGHYNVANKADGTGLEYILYAGSGAYRYPAFISGDAGTKGYKAGYTYYHVADMDLGTGLDATQMMPCFNGSAWWVATNFADAYNVTDSNCYTQNNYVKSFTLKSDTEPWSWEIGIGATDAAEGTATVRSLGIYRKPEAVIAASSVVDRDAKTIKVTFGEGIYDLALSTILADATIIENVTSVSQNGYELTFTVDSNAKEVVIPALVNAALDKTYNEVKVSFEEPDTNTIFYGIRHTYRNWVSEPLEAPMSGYGFLIENIDGQGVKYTMTESCNPAFMSLPSNAAFDDSYRYYHVADMDLVSGLDATMLMPTFNGQAWFFNDQLKNIYNADRDTDYYTAGNYVKSFSFTGEPWLWDMGIGFDKGLVGPEFTSGEVTVRSLGLYRKPLAAAAEAVSNVDSAAGMVTVTYPEGLYDLTLAALLDDPTVINGVKSVNQNGNSFTFTVQKGVDVTIPAFVNADCDGTYSEIKVNIIDTDVNAVKYGERVVYRNWINEPLTDNMSGAGFLVENRADGTGLKYTITDNCNPPFIAFSSAEFKDSYRYYHVADMDPVSGLDVTAMMPTLNGEAWFHTGQLKDIYTDKDEDYYTEGNYVKSFTFSGAPWFWDIGIGFDKTKLDSESVSGEVTVRSLGLYRKPNKTLTADCVVDCDTNTVTITFNEGVYDLALNTILAEPSIMNAETASFNENVLTLTAQDASDIYVPALVNAAKDATYVPVYTTVNTEIGMRVADNTGIRTISKIAQANRLDGTCYEYGYLVSRKVKLGETELTFDVDPTLYRSNHSYRTDERDFKYDMDDEYIYFSGVFTGIPQEYYNDVLVFRSYVKTVKNGVTNIVYGEPLEYSMYSVANYLLDNANLSDEELAFVENVIEIAENTNA